MPAIQLSNVTKRYGDVVAVHDLDLSIERGEIYGFLGPNGAGKSTTINLLLDFVRPTEGRIEVLGEDVATAGAALRERIGVLPEGFDVYDRLSGRQHVEFAVDSKGSDDDPDAILDRVGLSEAADRAAGGYSKGMCHRLALGMALVGEPELLILDEPSSGLDPGGAKEMREIVQTEADRGATVFFSSHILGQVEAVCDHVGILQEGELVAEDSVAALRATVERGDRLVLTVGAVDDATRQQVESLAGVEAVRLDDETLTVGCTASAKATVVTTLAEAGVEIRDFETDSTSLEELFLSYTDGEPEGETTGADAEGTGRRDGERDGDAEKESDTGAGERGSDGDAGGTQSDTDADAEEVAR